MSLGKVLKRRWRQGRYEQRAEHVGACLHGNPESGNHPGTVTLKESVEILTNPHTYHDQQKGGGRSKSTAQADSMLNTTARRHKAAVHASPAKAHDKTPNAHDSPNAAEQYWLKSNLA